MPSLTVPDGPGAAGGPDDRFDAFRIAAALDRILYDEPETFRAEDAEYLRRVVPRYNRSRFAILGRFSRTGGSTRGYAAGHGNVSMDEGEKHSGFSLGGDRITRVGQYKLTHDRSGLEIRQVMDDEWSDDERCARLVFTPEDRAEGLEVLSPRQIRVPLPLLEIVLCKVAWRPWKVPV